MTVPGLQITGSDLDPENRGVMPMLRSAILVCSFVCLFVVQAIAGGLEDFLGSLNVQARADLPGFSAKIGAQFGVPVPQVDAVIRTVKTPADAFMVFQLGRMATKPPETVLRTYKTHKGGWGAMAKELGIKPGSAEFHALKRGDFALTGAPGGGEGGPKGKGKGKGKGHNK